MSTHSNYKEHRKAIFDQLILSGLTKNYIRRALKVYERNYGHNYNIEVIAEIVRRLQKKDRNKARQKRHHLKSQSETINIGRSFTQKHKLKHNQSGGITPFDDKEVTMNAKVDNINIETDDNNVNEKETEKETEEDKEELHETIKRMHIKSSRSLNSKEFCVDTRDISYTNHVRSKTSKRKSVDHTNGFLLTQQTQKHKPYSQNDDDYGYSDDLKINRWIHLFKAYTEKKNNNKNSKDDNDVLDNDLLIYLNELKQYLVNDNIQNWEYLIEYDLLSVLTQVIPHILSLKYVNIWHKLISISLDIICVLVDYYLSVKIMHENGANVAVIGCILDIMSYHSVLLDYRVALARILQCCCSILGKLTFENSENIDCVVNMDGIEQILSIIAACKEEELLELDGLIMSCLNLLCVLCYNSDFNKEYICNNGGCHMILQLLSYFMSLSYHINETGGISMMNSILRTLGNFTFNGENISHLLDDSLLEILTKLITEMVAGAGSDSNMLVLLMQIVSDIASYCESSASHNRKVGMNISPWIIQSILKLSRKNRECLLLQQCMLNGIAILINLSPQKNSRILIENGGELEIFDVLKQLNYPQNIVVLSLRLIKSMCANTEISHHLVKESNLFNFLTHIMKHWRLKRTHDDIVRIQCCCKVIRSLTKVSKFSKYANKCHVISGLIKILMLNDGNDGANDDDDNEYVLSPILWIEIVKTFIAICIDEENCIKLAKHGTRYILNAIAVYQSDVDDKYYLADIIKYISILFCNISRYQSVCSVLYHMHQKSSSSVVVDIAYHLLLENTENVFICNQFILFLSNMLISVQEVYHMLETKLKCQSLINKILYLHSNYDPLIKTCHHYHKSIEIWLQNNAAAAAIAPVMERISNPYSIGDILEYFNNEWLRCRVVDVENNWILCRLINNTNIKLHAIKHKSRLRRYYDDDEEEEFEEEDDEVQMLLNEVRRYNWDLVIDEDDENNKNSLFQCFSREIYGDSINYGWKQIESDLSEYRSDCDAYFGNLIYSSSSRDYVTLIAASEFYCVRIRVFQLDRKSLTVLYDIGTYNKTLSLLPCIYLAYLKGKEEYFLIRDSSLNVHKRPLIINNSHLNNEESRAKLAEFRFYKFYCKLFEYFDDDGDGQLRGSQIYDFFVSSTLCSDILRTIWDESVGDNCPTMNVMQFCSAMNLILAEQIEVRQCANYGHVQHGSFSAGACAASSHTKFKPSQNKKIKVKTCTKIDRQILSKTHARNSANDAADNNNSYADKLIFAGIPIMSYPIHLNPFDLNQLLVNAHSSETHDRELQTHELQTTRTTTRSDHEYTPAAAATATAVDTDTVSADAADTVFLNRKIDEFIRFFNEIQFNVAKSTRECDVYYSKIAEYEYNDVEKMMQLDIDILVYDMQINQNDAIILLNRIEIFSKKCKMFKKWLISQCKMRKYMAKFVNEGILTMAILRNRCKSHLDLQAIIGDKNKNDAMILWRKIPNNKYKSMQ